MASPCPPPVSRGREGGSEMALRHDTFSISFVEFSVSFFEENPQSLLPLQRCRSPGGSVPLCGFLEAACHHSCFSSSELRNTGAIWQGGEAAVWDKLCVGVEREGRLTNRACESSGQRGAQQVAGTPWMSQDEGSPLRGLRGYQLRVAQGLPAAESLTHSPPSLLWQLHISSSHGGTYTTTWRHQSWP